MSQLNSNENEENIPVKNKKDKKKMSYGKKLLIFTFIIIILLLGSTTGVILYKRNDTTQIASTSEPEQTAIKEEDVEKMELTDFFKTNALTYTEKTDTIQRGIESDNVRYYEIDGLKDESLEENINNNMREIAYDAYEEHLSYLKENLNSNIQKQVYIEVYSFICFSYSNVISGNSYSSYWWDSETLDLESYIGDYAFSNIDRGFTYSLIDGEEISFEDVFLNNTNITYIVQRAIYEGLVWEQAYSMDTEEYDFSKVDYSSIENQVYRGIQNFKKCLEIGDLTYYIDNGMIYIFDVCDSEFSINLKDYVDDVAIYKRYLTTSSIYEDDSLAVENIFPFEPLWFDGNTKVYREITDNSFVDFYIYTSDSDGKYLSIVDNNQLEDLINKIKSEICSNGESFANMGYIFLSEDFDNPDNVYVYLELSDYSIAKSNYNTFFEIIRDEYQNSSAYIEIGIHQIPEEYDYVENYYTSFTFTYNVNTQEIYRVEWCSSDLKLFEEYLTDGEVEYTAEDYIEEIIEEKTSTKTVDENTVEDENTPTASNETENETIGNNEINEVDANTSEENTSTNENASGGEDTTN